MLNWMNPWWYKNTPKEVRIMYAKDMSKFAAFGGILAFLTKTAVDSIWKDDDIDFEIDPRSSDFLKLRVGNTRFDFYGGFAQYIRAFAQFATGKKKQLGSGEIVKLDGKSFGGANRMTPIWSLARGKAAPVPGAALDLFIGKDMVGNEMLYQFNNPFGEHPGGRTKTLDHLVSTID